MRPAGSNNVEWDFLTVTALIDMLNEGAFTGADWRRIGKFERCNGGTIFLDEIGDMPLATQGKILRLLQDQTFERVGDNETIQTDVRLIAATNRDLKAMSERGEFGRSAQRNLD